LTLSQLALAEGRAPHAVELASEALASLLESPQLAAADHPLSAELLIALAEARLASGELRDVEPALARSRAIRRATTGDEHPGELLALRILGDLRSAQGRHDEALALYRSAGSEAERLVGPESFLTATLLARQAEAAARLGARAEGEAAARRALGILLKLFGPDHAETRRAALALGPTAPLPGAKASPEYARLHEILDLAARSLSHEGRRHASAGETATALAMYRRAVAIHEALYGPEDPYLADLLEPFAELMRKAGRSTEALALDRRLQELRTR
jgi:hypothetical protein